NDEHGHLVGDEVLCQIGSLLSRHVRRSDTVARLGGDEFALLLVGANLVASRRKAHALAQPVAATAFPCRHLAGRLGLRLGLAASAGNEPPDMLMNRADMAMYGQKRRHAAARARN